MAAADDPFSMAQSAVKAVLDLVAEAYDGSTHAADKLAAILPDAEGTRLRAAALKAKLAKEADLVLGPKT